MRILSITISLFFSAFSIAQDMGQSLVSTNGGSNSMGLIDLRNFENSPTIEGSAYVNDKFLPARIEGVEGIYLLRYNNVNDDIEYQKDADKIFVLNKSEQKYDITFVGTKNKMRVYDYVDYYGNQTTGFLSEIYSSKISLLKKEKINYIPEKYPKNGYDVLAPAHFERVKDEYYIMEGDKIVSFPKNKKALIEMYPKKEEEINSFLKKNKLSFKDQNDMIGIVSFLSSVL